MQGRSATQAVRTDLLNRIDAIAQSGGVIAPSALCDQLDTIRRIAHVHVLGAVERMASLMETAVGYHGHGAIIFSYLDLMRDAAESAEQDEPAQATYLAALSLRMHG